MSRLTKSMAEDVAKDMTQKIKNDIAAKEDQKAEIVKEVYLKTVPQKVKDFFAEFPKWTSTHSYIRFEGVGVKYECMHLGVQLPMYDNTTILLDEETSNKIEAINREISDLKKKHQRLYKNTLEILLNLKTYKKITEQFPIAVDYLPQSNGNLVPMLPINDVLNELNAL